MLYNINIRIIGDISEYQDFHEEILETFRFRFDKLFDLSDFKYSIRGDFDFEYHPEVQKFKIISFPETLKGRVNYLIDVNREFKRKYII